MTHAQDARAALLVEIATEELPPKALSRLSESFSQSIANELARLGLRPSNASVESFASPRRLAVRLADVAAHAPDTQKEERLLPVSVGLDPQGKPTTALVKKLASLGLTLGHGIELSQLKTISDGKQEVFVCNRLQKGASLTEGLQLSLDRALSALPIPKLMRYQWPLGTNGSLEEVSFVRPAHHLLALHGAAVVPISGLGLAADRITLGHRFHCSGPIAIQNALSYEQQLEVEGHVIASFKTRRDRLVDSLQRAANGQTVVMPEALIDEVNGLVEWPVVLEGQFDEAFLSVPQECLILTMQQNQKYFAMTDSKGRLVHRFLLAANLESTHPQTVVQGNERVLRARLSDAKFFFDQDRKRRLEDRLPGFAAVTYHNKIGSQAERIKRLEQLAAKWAPQMDVSEAHARRAARLCKADLLSDMVGEFPELQGVVGRYYAEHDQEPAEISRAIEEHYRPRFAGDALPNGSIGQLLALADKLESIVGIWGIGLAPTGDKDPFAMRRSALGIARLLIEGALPFNLETLVQDAANSFSAIPAVAPPVEDILEFIRERTRVYLRDQGHDAAQIDAVLAVCPNLFHQLPKRLHALAQFMGSSAAPSLSSANKRIGNILKKAEVTPDRVDPKRLQDPAEVTLGGLLKELAPLATAAAAEGNYEKALHALSALKQPVDAFFDQVMVNAEDPALRANRLALLQELHRAMNQVADLSKLAATN